MANNDVPATYIGEPETHNHSGDEEGGVEVDPVEMGNTKHVPRGSDLANYIEGGDETLLLRPPEHNTDEHGGDATYEMSVPFTESLATKGLVIRGIGPMEEASSTPTIAYTGTGALFQWSDDTQPKNNIQIRNVSFDLQGGDIGTIAYWTNGSTLGPCLFRDNVGGLHMQKCWFSQMDHCWIRTSRQGADGFVFENSVNGGQTTVFQTHNLKVQFPDETQTGTGPGIKQTGNTRVAYYSPDVERSANAGFELNGVMSNLYDPTGEQCGRDMTTPTNYNVLGGRVQIHGGRFEGTGSGTGRNLYVDTDVVGSMIGGHMGKTVDSHIINDSTRFTIMEPKMIGASNNSPVNSAGPIFRKGLNVPNGHFRIPSSGTAVAAGDLWPGEMIYDEANGRICWKDRAGNAYYIGGTAL